MAKTKSKVLDASIKETGFYNAFVTATEKLTNQSKEVKEYLDFIEKSSAKLLDVLMKQGHTENSSYFVVVSFVDKYYRVLGIENPRVYLPKPGEENLLGGPRTQTTKSNPEKLSGSRGE